MTTLDKTASTVVPLHPLLAARWSSRAFDPDHEVTGEQLAALLEAARWAPSASNTQPWRFAVTRRGTAEHAAVLGTLAAGDQVWAWAASALVVVAARTTGADGAAQPWAVYDAGQAVAHLSVQAQAEGLAVHQMGGFDRDRLTAVLAAAGVTPLVVVAIGLRDEPERLTEPFAQRETAVRVRLPVGELLLPVRPQQAG
ncbi:nitroreductase family protein [Lentzea californiensis]|uniref:nitroreductase family protein n=1 Tax=Lentzea californiensis TaxID=438851 RepID=UPI0021656D22|nr:nitroreductase family protein [Lentzea californiensis]MCR3750769.1 Nitroreductase [Lentzea californiensis]